MKCIHCSQETGEYCQIDWFHSQAYIELFIVYTTVYLPRLQNSRFLSSFPRLLFSSPHHIFRVMFLLEWLVFGRGGSACIQRSNLCDHFIVIMHFLLSLFYFYWLHAYSQTVIFPVDSRTLSTGITEI